MECLIVASTAYLVDALVVQEPAQIFPKLIQQLREAIESVHLIGAIMLTTATRCLRLSEMYLFIMMRILGNLSS